jgi:glyoxalase family protein
MVHRIVWRVSSKQALEFWKERLASRRTSAVLTPDGLLFADPEGLEHELIVNTTGDEPLSARAPEIPSEHALQGFDGVRAYSADPAASADLLAGTLGFAGDHGSRWTVRGQSRGSFYAYDPPPEGVSPVQGAGSVHHVAFASEPQDHEAWRNRVAAAGARPTPVIDRFYFRSVYFREPSGVLFEIATIGPGFAVDEDGAHLGERLSLPPRLETLRPRLEEALTPLPASGRAPAPSPART